MKNILWNILKKIGNLNFSIFLLLFISCISILGTVIQQDQSLNYYQLNYPIANKFINYINWQIIINLGLNHIYTTWWFILLLTIFFISLIVCTFSRQLPGLKNSRNWKFLQTTSSLRKFKDFQILDHKLPSNIVYILNNKQYYVFHKKSSIYAYKGLLGRVAPIFVHISIILTLTGSLIGLFGGCTVQEMIPSGEIFHIQNVIKSGFNSALPDILGKVNSFDIEYNQDNSVKQFFSSISILNHQGDILDSKLISVNSPLKFRGITLYQTDWQINTIRLQIGTNPSIQKKLNKVKAGNTDIWVCNMPLNASDNIIIIITGLKESILIYDMKGLLIDSLNINDILSINNNSLIIKEIMTSTGIQMKTDPGLPIVYLGFLILMISVFISYLSYSQIWISGQNYNHNLELAGLTNRAALTFEEDIIYIQKKYDQLKNG